jgi:hypothetical protein
VEDYIIFKKPKIGKIATKGSIYKKIPAGLLLMSITVTRNQSSCHDGTISLGLPAGPGMSQNFII